VIGKSNRKSPPRGVQIFSWALFDLANTIFFFNIVSVHFALWIVNDMNGSDWDYGLANVLAMSLVILTAPILGALSDATGRRVPFLFVTTTSCVVFTCLLGIGGIGVSLAIFVLANYMFQSGLIFYDALLPSLTTTANRGKVGAIGVSVGYIGSLIGAGVSILWFDELGRVGMFRITGVLFFIFAIPCFIFVKEESIADWKIGSQVITNYCAQLRSTLTKARHVEGIPRFLIGRIFYTDAINTLIMFMGIYVTNELELPDKTLQQILTISIIGAILTAPMWGYIVDSVGPKKALNIVLYMWMSVLLCVAAIPIANIPTYLIWIIAPLSGIAMGGVWCADRPYLIRLAPEDSIGEFFGLYSLVGRFASIVGPLLWVFVSQVLGLGRPVAILSLLAMIVIAYVILRGVNDQPMELRATPKTD
jgi:UMF1 family MFS transporter